MNGTTTMTRTLGVFLSACLATSMALAQGNNAGNNSAAKASRTDTAFLKQAAENGHAEVESSKLALEKVKGNEPVRRFAQMMVDDHQKAGAELKSLAASKGVQISDEPSVLQRARIKMLSTSDGDNFARRYIETMGVDAHKDTIELFQKAAANAEDADVKAFASRTLPTLQKHMTAAHDLHATHQGSGNTQGGNRSNTSGTATRSAQ